ncbi:MAG: hypothetical protein J5697_03190 [Clostridia bacterium]|nr:hypothetical protein [Clostridia bacterium]
MRDETGKTQYDYMRESDYKEEDALFPEEIREGVKKTEKEEYFEFYDDVKTSIKEDW